MKYIHNIPIVTSILSQEEIGFLADEASFTFGDAEYTLVCFNNLPEWIRIRVENEIPSFNYENGVALMAVEG